MFKFYKNKRWGKKLIDKKAHAADHEIWSRRQFLLNSGVMGAGGALLGTSSFSWLSPFLSDLYNQNGSGNDRVLILIRLDGGNDGLNTIVPFGNNPRRVAYQNFRQNLAYANTTNALSLLTTADGVDSEFALPKQLTGMLDMWDQNKMAVIHNVGYENMNGSHFVGADLWASAAVNNVTAQDQRKYSGWIGRYFEETLPAFLSAPPLIPPAIQIGKANNLMFRGKNGVPHDLVFSDLDAFDELIANGAIYDGVNTGSNCPADIEHNFVRNIANSAYRYADSVSAAWNRAESDSLAANSADYTDALAEKMFKVVRLIQGHLGTKIYLIELGGFDTHSDQNANNRHINLLSQVSNAVHKAYQDLTTTGDADRVMMMTLSEFGREIEENGSFGTDHGTLAPVMLFGGGINGKQFYGTPPDISSTGAVNNDGAIDFDTQDGAINYRTVYEKVLRDWLCADPQTTENVLNYGVEANTHPDIIPYTACNPPADAMSDACTDPLGGMIQGGCGAAVSESSNYETYIASQILFGYNIFDDGGTTKVKFKYAIKSSGNVELKIVNNDANRSPVTYDVWSENEGTTVILKLNPILTQYREANSYTHVFDPTDILNTDTKYVCQLSVNGMVVEKIIEIH